MRAITFTLQAEIPRVQSDHSAVTNYLIAIKPQLGPEWGRFKTFGIGFVWASNRKISNHRLALVKRHLLRAMTSAGICRPSSRANVYNLEQRIHSAYGTTPKAAITMKED